MKLVYEDLIYRYNIGDLTEEETELFYLGLEYNKRFREEFTIYVKMKYFILDDLYAEVGRFLKKNLLINGF